MLATSSQQCNTESAGTFVTTSAVNYQPGSDLLHTLPANQQTEGVAENEDVDVVRQFVLQFCNGGRERCQRSHIRFVAAKLPNTHKLKPEQEQVLLSFVGSHDVLALLPTGFGNSLIFQLRQLAVTVVVKELAKANASDWLWQIRVALGRSNSFKLEQSTRLQGSQRSKPRLSVQMKCTRVWL